MDCNDVRPHLLDRRRNTLSAAVRTSVDAHLTRCEACRSVDIGDGELSDALRRLPRPNASPTLHGLVERLVEGASARHERSLRPRTPVYASNPFRAVRSSVFRTFALVASGAAIAVFALAIAFWSTGRASDEALVTESVNDHLRVLYSQHPIEVETGGIHQVKPWFEGRLDFAPALAFAGDDEFALQGGSVAYFVDRKAAAFVFKRRLHLITLYVFRAEGLRWPSLGLRPMGSARASLRTSRGFHVVLWRDGDLGYSLVSDVNEGDLFALGAKVAAVP